ncbi:RUN and FYVE domain-containing protein 2 isoform X3 [Hippoglossus hippoglossus]|uniref:RUN and FYVE domain-containing protein 2 isoform X3 n=1 Tax=Hippoglossus hippoglossus TaxID=8267 RepID=UPI00148C4D18|nr:RUN and FYVE domain-containing protein 2 isoform X3 [Hippoglossus hippoglossus]
MSDHYSLNSIDGLLCQSALQTRELSQKKNEFIQRIKVCRADIAERRSYIDTLHRNIKKLEEETRGKQSTAMYNKANARSMKTTNRLLLQYEQTLKAELESRKDSFNHDTEVYEERIASYRKKFQSHQEYYLQNPTAQKLLKLQGEKEEIECRIKACDDQITMKQAELDHLTGPEVTVSSTEKLLDSVTGQQPEEEAEKQLDPQTEDCDSAIDSFCLHLNQTKMLQNGDKVSVEAGGADIPEEHKVQDTTACSTYPEEAGRELWSHQQLDEQSWTEEMQTNEQEKDTELQEQEQQSNVSEEEEAAEDKAEEGVGTDEEQTSSEKDNEELVAFPQSSCEETNSQASVAKTTAAPSTTAFPFNFSPASGTSDTKSPAFLFSLNSDPSTPGFSGFGFDTSQAEQDTNFAFTGSFFNEKKTTDTKSSSGGEFLFDQSEQGEDFQFAFNFKSPQATTKEKSREDFPFSFNF